jgi:hypothetical protein
MAEFIILAKFNKNLTRPMLTLARILMPARIKNYMDICLTRQNLIWVILGGYMCIKAKTDTKRVLPIFTHLLFYKPDTHKYPNIVSG